MRHLYTPVKKQRIRAALGADVRSRHENKPSDKHVESTSVNCLDGGSTPPSSTKRDHKKASLLVKQQAMDTENTKKDYIVPQLTVVSFKAERGYFASDYMGQMNLMQEEFVAEGEDARQMEYYSVQDWHNGGDFWD